MVDFSNFDPNAAYAENVSDFMGFKARQAAEDGCVCNACVARRMKAATCKCGHVGAECFNDSYCEPSPKMPTIQEAMERALHFESLLANAVAEIDATHKAHKHIAIELEELKRTRVPIETFKFWHDAYMEKSSSATQVEIKLQNRITELEERVDSAIGVATSFQDLHSDALETINDLQADYASDIQAWHNVYTTNEQVNDETFQEQADRIEELETTIRVLSGMVNS